MRYVILDTASDDDDSTVDVILEVLDDITLVPVDDIIVVKAVNDAVVDADDDDFIIYVLVDDIIIFVFIMDIAIISAVKETMHALHIVITYIHTYVYALIIIL